MDEARDSVFRHRFGGPRLRVAMPLAVLVAAVAWAGAAQLGSWGAEAGAGPGSSGGPAVAGAGASPRETPRPGIEWFGEPIQGSVLVRGEGLRTIDLTTGRLSPPIGPVDWSSEVVATPDGDVWCLCATVDHPEGETALSLRLARVDELGRVAPGGEPVGRWIGAPDDAAASDQQGSSVWATAEAAPDGGSLAVGVTVRRPPVWERYVVIVDLVAGRVVQSVELADIASADRGVPTHAWAPELDFAPGGDHLLISATTLTGHAIARRDVGVASVRNGRLGPLRALDGFDAEGCPDADPRFVGDALVYAVCAAPSSAERSLRRVMVDGGALPDVDLTDSIGASWPARLVDAELGRIYLWDSITWHAVSIDASTGRIAGSLHVPDDAEAAADPWMAAARAVSRAIAPVARAKVVHDPAMALSSDGSVLYVLGSDRSDRLETRLFALETDEQLSVIGRWSVPGLASGIGLGVADTLVVPTHPVWDAQGGRLADAGLRLIDSGTGDLRAIVSGLGDAALTLVDGSWPPG